MPIYKKTFIFLVLFIAFGAVAYQFGKQKSVSFEVNPKQEEGLFNCPYSMEGGIYKEFVRSVNEVEVVGKPQFIDKPEIIKLNKPFNEQEFEEGLYKLSTNKGWESREFDVDGDGESEMIVNANVAMTQSPHIATIVDNGNIIFNAGGAGIWIEEVHGGQGFILKETVDWNTGEEKRTRYVYKDGGFMPVWTQKVCWVKFE